MIFDQDKDENFFEQEIQEVKVYEDRGASSFGNNPHESANKDAYVETKQGLSNKPKKNILKWILIGIGGLLLIGFIICLILFLRLMSVTEQNAGKVWDYVISKGHWECLNGHELGEANCLHGTICKNCKVELGTVTDHDYDEATCIHLATCKICNKTTGKYAEHQWGEPDCITPSTCSVCKETKGEPLGHTTKLGYCERCGEEINREAAETLCDMLLNIIQNDKTAYELVNRGAQASYVSDTYNLFISARDYFYSDYGMYDEAIGFCEGYEELNEAKQLLQNAKDAIPGGDFWTARDSLQTYLDSANNYLGSYEKVAGIYNALLEHRYTFE